MVLGKAIIVDSLLLLCVKSTNSQDPDGHLQTCAEQLLFNKEVCVQRPDTFQTLQDNYYSHNDQYCC